MDINAEYVGEVKQEGPYRKLDAPLRLFQRLWEPLFTPAIGLLMAAALLSGAIGWWQRRGRR